MSQHYHLVIIGAGPGGYEAAIEAARRGFDTALVEDRELGGTCLNRGCIPTKTILHSARQYYEFGHSAPLGIHADNLSCDMEQVQKRKSEVLDQLRQGIALCMKMNKVTVISGHGMILDKNHVKISLPASEPMVLEADRILIATGSGPALPGIPGIDLPGVLTSDQILDSAKHLERLIIIGGGVIGMEFASIYSYLGTKVTVIEALDRILFNMDRELSQNLKLILKKRGVDIHTCAKVESISAQADSSLVCHYIEKDQTWEAEGNAILVAVGRRPNTKGLLADGFSLAMDQGYLTVNENFQTNYENIYAIGDVIGGLQLAHAATAQGRSAVSHMAGIPSFIHTDTIPGCVYTQPEIASVGCTVDEAKKMGLNAASKKYLMSANGKSVLSMQERGFIKVVWDKDTNRILGAQMMCARATDMISEFSTAIVNNLTLKEMASVVRPHPTFSEGISQVLLDSIN